MSNVKMNTTVAELREIAKSLQIKGQSKLNRDALIVAIGDVLYDEAMAIHETIVSREAFWQADSNERTGKTFNERMFNRLTGYYLQNGHSLRLKLGTVNDSITVTNWASQEMIDTLTPAQRRRYAKKMNRNLAKLLS